MLTSTGPPLVRSNRGTVDDEFLGCRIVGCASFQTTNERAMSKFGLLRKEDLYNYSLNNKSNSLSLLTCAYVPIISRFHALPIHSACCSDVPWPMIVGKNITKCTLNGLPSFSNPDPSIPPRRALFRVKFELIVIYKVLLLTSSGKSNYR